MTDDYLQKMHSVAFRVTKSGCLDLPEIVEEIRTVDLELALIPESFRTDILKETLDDNGVLVENSDVELESFALLFEFDGDQKHISHVLYNCSASRPKIEGQ